MSLITKSHSFDAFSRASSVASPLVGYEKSQFATVLGSIPQHHDPKMWEALRVRVSPPDMDEIKAAIRQLKGFREGP
jgi:hypothetical protein